MLCVRKRPSAPHPPRRRLRCLAALLLLMGLTLCSPRTDHRPAAAEPETHERPHGPHLHYPVQYLGPDE